jgi:hypothetical protein
LEQSRALRELVDWYGGLAPRARRRSANPYWPVELAALAQRERRADRPLLALIRLALAQEVALQVRLVEAHGLDVDHLNEAEQEEVRQRLAQLGNRRDDPRLVPLRGDGGPRRWRLEGVADRFALLCALESGLAQGLAPEMARAQEQLVEVRNDLVHRGTHPSPSGVQNVFEAGLAYLAWLFGVLGWRDPRRVPSGPDAVAQLAGEVAEGAGVGLE